jgi:DNA-binding transcriptional ArsR family regulator
MLDQLGQVFEALGEPNRRIIVERLSQGPAPMKKLKALFPTSLAAVMQHVQRLEQCGLVRTEKLGRERICHLEPRALRIAERWIEERRTEIEERLNRLAVMLTEEERKRAKKK